MQQNLNYLYPQIYWVDSRASPPCVPPVTTLPCPSPGLRSPPPPPPPPPPPLPLPHCPPFLPYSFLKKRTNNTSLCLLLVFFMVLVALTGLGIGMFQLFHLQEEIAKLRESTSNGQSPEQQIGLLNTLEMKALKKAAHVTGKSRSQGIPLEWEDTYGHTFVSGVKYKNRSLVINDTGLYFVYSKVYFRGQKCDNQLLQHILYKRNPTYPRDLVLMEEMKMNYCTSKQMWAQSSYLGAVFNLTRADSLYVNVSAFSLVNFEETKTFFGLYKL